MIPLSRLPTTLLLTASPAVVSSMVSSRPSVSVYRCVPRPRLPPGVFVQALQECLFALLVVFFGKPVTLNVETRIELRVGIF